MRVEDFVLDMAGGATPAITQAAKYYAEKGNGGVPFLRVQNLDPSGELQLGDVKHINKETHNGLLKRSQVGQDDLLVKITGVGRMAVSSVPCEGFSGNINQHIVCIKTKDRQTSEVLAAFLNSNVGERLASRRSTGGTRPALDYPALKSIPVFFDPKLAEVMREAHDAKKKKEIEAERLLNSIDDFVLQELGIKKPRFKNKLCFSVESDALVSRRIDPKAYQEEPRAILASVKKSTYPKEKLENLILENTSGEWGEDSASSSKQDFEEMKVLRNTNFDNKTNLNFEDVAVRFIPKGKVAKVALKKYDLLVEKSGGSPIQPVGRVAIIEDQGQGFGFSNFLSCIRIDAKRCLPGYLFVFLRVLYRLNYMEYIQNQTTGIKNLIMEEFEQIPVVIPARPVQESILNEYQQRLAKAEKLKKEAQAELEAAKAKVEKMILGREA